MGGTEASTRPRTQLLCPHLTQVSVTPMPSTHVMSSSQAAHRRGVGSQPRSPLRRRTEPWGDSRGAPGEGSEGRELSGQKGSVSPDRWSHLPRVTQLGSRGAGASGVLQVFSFKHGEGVFLIQPPALPGTHGPPTGSWCLSPRQRPPGGPGGSQHLASPVLPPTVARGGLHPGTAQRAVHLSNGCHM